MSSASASASASAPAPAKEMKSIPMKYLKYMCYGMYMLKRICPHPEEYAARSVELLKLHSSVEDIIHDIDAILDGPLQTEMHEIKTIRKNMNKPPKVPKVPKVPKKDLKPLAAAIVDSANQCTVEHVIAASDSDNEEPMTAEEIFSDDKPVTKKLKKVSAPVPDVNAVEKAVIDALKADEKAQKAVEKAQKEAERAAEKAQKEQEKAQKEAERAAEKAQKEQEKAQKEAERAAEKAKKEQEKAIKKVSKQVNVVASAELTADNEH